VSAGEVRGVRIGGVAVTVLVGDLRVDWTPRESFARLLTGVHV